ncbi:hypothetical protein F53441_12640 [Fusarium austroafricanum]|uniref:Uncharacterized protein n=1 Tax=Fusarium austroafricanum TaxID=2364996 RepID=A0A8H4NIK8_9HYPO|nr:hypothetical protein F53441_12640 [Fusarium austroafricanum]
MENTTPADMSSGSGTANPTNKGSAAPAKPSLRIITEHTNKQMFQNQVLDESSTGFTTLQEDLAHGSLLRGMGGGYDEQDGSFAYHTNLDSAFEASSYGDVEISGLPLFPSGFPATHLTESMSPSEVTQSGPSLPVPSESMSYAGLSSLEERTGIPASQEGVTRPFSWEYEFHWGESLCFDGQPLGIVEPREEGRFSRVNPGSEHALSVSQRSAPKYPVPIPWNEEFEISVIAGIGSFGDSDEHWAALELAQDLEAASIICSISSDAPEYEITDLSTHAEIHLHKAVEDLVGLFIDDFLRSYLPQRTENRPIAKRHRDVEPMPVNLTNKIRKSKTQAGNKPRPHRRRAVGDDERSEDDDSPGDGPAPSVTQKSENSRTWACPFIKWKPEYYVKTCRVRLTTPSRVKQHIRDKHIFGHCSMCFYVFSDDKRNGRKGYGEEVPPHPCQEIYARQPVPPVGLITEEMQIEFKRRLDKHQSPKEQWYRLYRLIFPNERRPLSPYLNFEAEQKFRAAEDYFSSPFTHMKLRKEAQGMGFRGARLEGIIDMVCNRWLPQCWEDIPSDGQMSFHKAQEEEQEVEHAQGILSVETDMNVGFSDYTENTVPYHPKNTLAGIQPYHLSTLTNIPASIPELSENQLDSDDNAYRNFPNINGDESSLYAAESGDTSLQENAFRTSEGGNLCLYEGEDTVMTEPNQMCNDSMFQFF